MGRSAKITRFFGDGDHPFALLIDQLEELQETFDCGVEDTRAHLAAIRVKDIYAVLRLGLIGGGMDKELAYRLVVRHVVSGELAECALLAIEVINAAVAGVPDEPLGELKGDETQTLSPEAKSGSPISTGPAPRSATRRKKSDGALSGSSGRPLTDSPAPTALKAPRARRARTSTTQS